MSQSAESVVPVDVLTNAETPVVLPTDPNKDPVKFNISGPAGAVVDRMDTLRSGPRSAGIPNRRASFNSQSGAAELLSQIIADGSCAGWLLDIRRTGPAVFNGEALAYGTVDRVQPLLYQELLERIISLNGGGDYRVLVVDDQGAQKNVFNVKIDTLSNPPINRSTGNRVATGVVQQPTLYGMPALAARQAGVIGEEDDVIKIRNEERTVTAQIQRDERIREKQRRDRQWEKEQREDEERRERKDRAPVEAAAVAAKEQASQFERSMMMMQQSQDKLLSTLLPILVTPKQDNMQPMMLLMVESMKQQTQMMLGMMQQSQQQAAAKTEAMSEMTRIQIEANKTMMDTALKASQGGNSRYDKLIESMVVQNINAPKNSIKDALDLMERGRQQTLEMMEMRGDKEEDDSYDPEAGFLGNLGRGIFSMLKSVLKGNNGQMLMGLLSMLRKQNPNQVTTQDLQSLAHMMEQGQVPLLPMHPAAGAIPMQQPLTAIPQIPAPGGTRQGVPMQQAVSVIQRPSPNVIQMPRGVEAVYEEEPRPVVAPTPQPPAIPPYQAPAATPAAQPMSPIENMTADDRLRDVVSEAMEIAIDDMRNGVREHDWVNFAIGKWTRSFLDELSTTPLPEKRIELIQQKCDQEIFATLYQMLTDMSIPHNYQYFTQNMEVLIQEHTQVAPAGAA